ncbi:MAG TPA: hypothetical protein VGX96_06780 [Candidatus Elarobacter sp.]|jgi:hypothetical protein|nr:hypothetical protein [Candidatus Elarobacter sp.]
MNRFKLLSALAALTVGGALAANVAPASAFTSFNVSFAVQNMDGNGQSMIRTSAIPTGVTGLINPASAISPSANDPATGHATYSLPYPGVRQSSEATITYANSSNPSLNVCTYKIKVTENSASSFTLHFTTNDAVKCAVPSDASSGDGQFTSLTYGLTWST